MRKETNWDILDKVIEKFPDNITPYEMEECVHNEDDDEKKITAENRY